jgi:hypothetical protein
LALGISVAAFLCCRTFSPRAPVLAMALIAFNESVFYYGSSIRAYGLAAVLILLCFSAFWRLVQRPTTWNIAAAFVLAALSVHANYQNSYLVFGIGTAAALVCALDRSWKRAILVLTICLFAGCSLLVYIPTIIKYRDITEVSRFALDWRSGGGKLVSSLSGGRSVVLGVWLILLVAAVAAPIVQRFGQDRSHFAPSRQRLYVLLTVFIAGVVGLAFFKSGGMYPFPWHYVPFITLLAVGVEINLGSPHQPLWGWLSRMAAVGILVALSIVPLWEKAHLRRTNVDLASAAVAEKASADDLVLAAPFYFAPSVNYYYHGAAPWTTLPAIPIEAQTRNAHYMAIKKLMATPDALEPTLEMIRKTLAGGNRVWILGFVEFLPPNAKPPSLSPAPDPQFGWSNYAYSQAWAMQAGYYFQTHALGAQLVPISKEQPVDLVENLSVIRIEGWRKD